MSQHLAYGFKSDCTSVPVQVVYQHPFHSWQLSVGISEQLALFAISAGTNVQVQVVYPHPLAN
jgi:hypothetical protein